MRDFIDWNQMSELGLIYKINHEILHSLGLAISRNPDTGTSDKIYIASDGAWEYPPDAKHIILTDDEIREKLKKL